MPFTKNDKNINTQGRKKGVPNKTTYEFREDENFGTGKQKKML